MSLSMDERWDLVDAIIDRTVVYGEREESLSDKLSELTVRPWTGLPLAVAVLYGFWSFFSSFAGWWTDGIFVKLFDDHWYPWLLENFPTDPNGLIYFIFVGNPLGAETALESFGVLTSGLFVAIGIVLPAVFAMYLFITILEDSGYIPRLVVLLDTFLHKVGLHGFAIVPMVLSLGCNVPGVTATRNLQTRKQRFMMIALLSVFIPCGAQIGVMNDLVPEYVGWVMLWMLLGLFVFAVVLDRLIPGENPEMIMDIPSYRMPSRRNTLSKLWVRTSGFLIHAIPYVLLGVALVNLLYYTDLMSALEDVFAPVISGIFGVPKETAPAFIAGFLRKDLPIAILGDIPMSSGQLMVSIVAVSLFFPCVATFIMVLKEGFSSGFVNGLRFFFGALAFLFAVVVIWCLLLRGILSILGMM